MPFGQVTSFVRASRPGIIRLFTKPMLIRQLYGATINTFRGFACAIRGEPAFRKELVLFAIALPLGLSIAPSAGWYIAMVGVMLAIMAVELLNTGLEKLADHITSDWHPQIRIVKDMGSAAVFCTLVLAGVVWAGAVAVRFKLL